MSLFLQKLITNMVLVNICSTVYVLRLTMLILIYFVHSTQIELDSKWYTFRSPRGKASLCKSEVLTENDHFPFLEGGCVKYHFANLKSWLNMIIFYLTGGGEGGKASHSNSEVTLANFGTHFWYTVRVWCFTFVSRGDNYNTLYAPICSPIFHLPFFQQWKHTFYACLHNSWKLCIENEILY